MDRAGRDLRRRADTTVDTPHERGVRGVSALIVRAIAAGRTGPNRALRFGSEELDLDATGRRDCSRLLGQSVGRSSLSTAQFCGPEASVVQSAEVLGIECTIDPGLRAVDLGHWRGRMPEEIDLADLRVWFTDVAATPHGGESIAEFVARVGGWFDAHAASDSPGAEITVVAAMSVVQALIAHVEHGGPDGFWTIAVEPASERIIDTASGQWRGSVSL